MEKQIKVQTPMTPNYIRIGKSPHTMIAYPIVDFDEDELREIGRLWTEELVAKAAKRRKRPQSSN